MFIVRTSLNEGGINSYTDNFDLVALDCLGWKPVRVMSRQCSRREASIDTHG
jgi:hypothetical protein